MVEVNRLQPSVVMRVDPARRRRRRTVTSVLVLLALVASFGVGRRLRPESEVRAGEISALQQQAERQRQQIGELKQRLANAETGARVDREMLVPLRLTLLQREHTIAGLREQLALCQGLLTPKQKGAARVGGQVRE